MICFASNNKGHIASDIVLMPKSTENQPISCVFVWYFPGFLFVGITDSEKSHSIFSSNIAAKKRQKPYDWTKGH